MTEAEIEAGKSPRGGWTRATLEGWGVPWPLVKGWKQRLIDGDRPPDRPRREAASRAGLTQKERNFLSIINPNGTISVGTSIGAKLYGRGFVRIIGERYGITESGIRALEAT